MPKPIKCDPLEERRVVDLFVDATTGSKAEAVFNSSTDRFQKRSYLNYVKNPGPQDYKLDGPGPKYMLKGPVDTQFGSTVERNSLLLRDVSKSPFKNPTNLENPSPSQYRSNLHEMSREYSVQTKQSSPGFIN